jgi:hypothetical protein
LVLSFRGQAALASAVVSARTLGLTKSPEPANVKTAKSLKSQRVAKTYAPDEDGAKRFSLRHGSELVCVRHRISDDGLTRFTTVELLVESTPITPRARTLVALRLPPTDRPNRSVLLACGGTWEPKTRVWLVPYTVARSLRLLGYRTKIAG